MMKLDRTGTKRAFLVYIVALAAAWILTEIVWGAAGGLVGGLSMARNPEYLQRMTALMKDKGINPDASEAEAEKAYENLSKEDRQELMSMTQDALADVNWFAVTIFVSAVVFGLVGFFSGFIARSWWLAGMVPALSFHTNNPLVRFSMAKNLSDDQKLVVVVFAQFAVCYLLAYCGARLGSRWKRKRESATQPAEGDA